MTINPIRALRKFKGRKKYCDKGKCKYNFYSNVCIYCDSKDPRYEALDNGIS